MKFLNEPLLHFIVLAGLLFIANHFWSSKQKQQIVIDNQSIAFLVEQREALELRKLNGAERKKLIDDFIIDEVLYNEAYKRGLDRSDSRMRRNLIRKMRTLLIEDVQTPSEKELRAFFDANRVKYQLAATRSMEQVFFSDPGTVPNNLREQLNAGLDASGLGESSMDLRRSLPNLTQRDIALRFGAEAASAIIAINDKNWHGPIESDRGFHFIRITGSEPSRDFVFENIRPYVERDWVLAQSREAMEQAIAKMRQNYEIIIEKPEVIK